MGIFSTKAGYYLSNCVDVTVNTIDEMLTAKRIIKEHRSELSELFAKAWIDKGDEINSEHYGSGIDLYFQVYSNQERYINTHIRNTRDQISESVKTKIPHELIPKYFLCHSSNFDNSTYPSGYYSVFNDPKALIKSEPLIQGLIRYESIRLLKEGDVMKLFEERYFALFFIRLISTCMDYLEKINHLYKASALDRSERFVNRVTTKISFTMTEKRNDSFII